MNLLTLKSSGTLLSCTHQIVSKKLGKGIMRSPESSCLEKKTLKTEIRALSVSNSFTKPNKTFPKTPFKLLKLYTEYRQIDQTLEKIFKAYVPRKMLPKKNKISISTSKKY